MQGADHLWLFRGWDEAEDRRAEREREREREILATVTTGGN